MLSCYWSKQSLYLAGVMLPGKTVKSIPSASPSVKLLLRRDFTESTLYCDCCYDVKNRLLEKKKHKPETTVWCENQWVSTVLDWSSCFWSHVWSLSTFVHRSYLQGNRVGKPFQLSARVHDFSPSVGCRVFVWRRFPMLRRLTSYLSGSLPLCFKGSIVAKIMKKVSFK